MAGLRIARAARRDLDEIVDYLLARSPGAAERIGAVIAAKIDVVAQYPEIGPLVERREGRQYRRTAAGDYVIWYSLDAGGDVLILGVRHGRRRTLSGEDLDHRAQAQQ